MFRHIMFDLDGTVTDSGEAIMASVRAALSQLGYDNEPEEKLKTFIGPSLYDSFHREYGFEGETAEKAIKTYRDIYEGGKMYEVEIYEGIPELLSDLKEEGYTVYLVTSKPLVFSEKIIERIGLSPCFSHIIAPDLQDHDSDKKRLIEKVVSVYGADKEECVMIGDTKYDILGAVSAGVKSIGVTFGFGKREELIASGADYIADSAEDIRRIIIG